MTHQQEVVRSLLDRFPNSPALTLGKKLFREHPGLWPSLNAAHCAIRRVLGVQGKFLRKATPDKTLYREPRMAGVDYFEDIPDGIKEIKDWDLYRVDGPLKALVINDVHIPFHDPALKVALRRGKGEGCNSVILNGDILDCHDQSKFEKDPTKKFWAEELRTVRVLLESLRKEFGKKARIIYKMGNHEERYIAYMRRQCPIYLDIMEFDFPEITWINKFGVELVDHHRPIAFGKLNILHGHEYRMASAVNAARGLFLRAKAHSICGHLHATSSHAEPNVEQTVLSTWSIGCLCDLHPLYRPINNWNHGFAIVDVASGGEFEVQNFKILKGRPYRA